MTLSGEHIHSGSTEQSPFLLAFVVHLTGYGTNLRRSVDTSPEDLFVYQCNRIAHLLEISVVQEADLIVPTRMVNTGDSDFSI